MHQHLHADEAVGGALIQSDAGKIYFPGAQKAVVLFVERDVPGTDEMFDAERKLPIGCGGEVRFNDHRGPQGRVRGECASTLVAKYIKVYGLPAYERLLSETLENDTRAHASRTQLSELLKKVHRYLPDNSLDVYNWARMAIDAIIEREKWARASVKGEVGLMAIFRAYRTKMKSMDKEILDRMEKWIETSVQSGAEKVTELSYMVAALFRRLDPATVCPAYNEATISEWCELPFRAMYHEQVAFKEVSEALRMNPPKVYEIQAELRGKERKLRLISFVSDSKCSLKAALSLRPDVAMIRTSTGNVRINTSNNVRGITLEDVTRMIRFLEAPADKKNSGNWTQLGKGGEHEFAPWWYYDVQAEALYNGTETHISVPSKIGSQALLEVLLYGFYPEAVVEWCKNRGISLFRRTKGGDIFWSRKPCYKSHQRRRSRNATGGQAATVKAGNNSVSDALEVANAVVEDAKLKAKADDRRTSRRAKSEKPPKSIRAYKRSKQNKVVDLIDD